MRKRSDIIDVIIRDNQLVLSDQLISLLKVKPGDKIAIGYEEREGNLVPLICVDDSGNKLNKSNTVSFRGKQRDFLGQFGSNFWASESNGIVILEGDGLPIFSDVKKAAEAYITKEIILDTNFNITKLENYEF